MRDCVPVLEGGLGFVVGFRDGTISVIRGDGCGGIGDFFFDFFEGFAEAVEVFLLGKAKG